MTHDELARAARTTEAPMFADVVERIACFEAHEPQVCLWCAWGGVVYATDPLEALVCKCPPHTKWVKEKASTLPPVPDWPNARPFLRVVDAGEVCEHWRPTRVGSARMKVMQALGLLDDDTLTKRIERERRERREQKRKRKAAKREAGQ